MNETATTGPHDPLTDRVIGLPIEIHRGLGPGFLESAYEECLCYELRGNSIPFERQMPLPVLYKSVRLDCGYRMVIVIVHQLIVELKTVERLIPVHYAQLLNYIKLSGIGTGLLLNFSTPVLRYGLRRMVL